MSDDKNGKKIISCIERDKILIDKSGVFGMDWAVESSLTDLCGEFGDPRVETTWVSLDGDHIKDVRHPSGTDEKDVAPCEHYQWGTIYEN